MGVRYIGSKARIADEILDLVGQSNGGRFIDAFCGTGSVAAAAATRGWPITINDTLPSAVAMATGATIGRGDISFAELGGYSEAIQQLNATRGRPGFIHAEYSPASVVNGQFERKYFTEKNACRIDAIRSKIGTWFDSGKLTIREFNLLIADLISAANSVANISGTYGCFLKSWTPAAMRPVELKERPLPNRSTDLMTFVGDAAETPTTGNDTIYFDPPYTKRQYSAYYHILETIYAGDSPKVSGVTGLRPWKDKASDFSYKSRALDALVTLIRQTYASRVLLSYSNEGHVPKELLVNALEGVGDVSVHEIKTIGRYRPNARASKAAESVNEFVIEILPYVSQRESKATLDSLARLL